MRTASHYMDTRQNVIYKWGARNLIRNAEKQIRWHCLCGGGNEDSVCCAKAAAILGPQD